MAEIICPDCKAWVSETAGSCPHCVCQLTPEIIAEFKRKERNGKRVFFTMLGTLIFIFGLAFSGIFPAPKSPSSAPSIAPPPAPAPLPPQSDPPSPPSQEPVQQASPEEQIVDGTLLDWRNSDKDTRIRAADYYNLVFTALRGNGRELSKIERAAGAVILDRCLMHLAQDPAVRNSKVQDMAAVCLVALESQ